MGICHCTIPHMYGHDACKGYPNLHSPFVVDEPYSPFKLDDYKIKPAPKFDHVDWTKEFVDWTKEIGSKLVKEEETLMVKVFKTLGIKTSL